MSSKKTIMIVGGGITGLSSAYYLQKKIQQEQLPFRIVLVEKGQKLGGKIQTANINGFTIEKGPDSFLAKKPAIMDLTRELGLENELVGTNQVQKNNYILRGKRLHLMPPGLLMGIPTQLTPFVKTGLISPIGKLRAALDLVLPAKKGEEDEALGEFLKRRLGREVAENIAEPLLSGIYAGDTDELSLQATFPQFQDLERKYSSLIKGMIAGKMAAKPRPVQAESKPQDKNKASMFLTYRTGLYTLINRLEQELKQVEIHRDQSVRAIHQETDGYIVSMENGDVQHVDALILTAPAFAIQDMLKDVGGVISHLSQVDYVSVLNIAMAFNRKDINHPLGGYGFVVPRKEGRHITACTWVSSKWPHAMPEDKILLRCYIGHSRDQSKQNESDESLLEKARADLKDIMGIDASPLFYHVSRWDKSMPQYKVGHKQRLAELQSELGRLRPGVFLAGSAFRGVGIPDCISQGKEAAELAVQFLS